MALDAAGDSSHGYSPGVVTGGRQGSGPSAGSVGTDGLGAVPAAGLARWVMDGQFWEVQLGVVWFDAPGRRMELVWRVAGGAVYHYVGTHWSSRERFYVYPPDAPYTDLALDMERLVELVVASRSGGALPGEEWLKAPLSYDLYLRQRGRGLEWALFFVRLPHWIPLMRAGWFWRPGPDGLEKTWHLTAS
jgi:hypothetical protein